MSSGSRCQLVALACCLTLGGCSGSDPGTTSTTSPQASLSPATLTFTSQNVGAASSSQTVTLSNAGTGALAITQIAASGDFAETSTCGSSVAAGASCAISVIFTPTAAGARTGNLTVTDNASGSPHTAPLNGTGAAPAPHASLNPSSLTFASQATGSISAAQTVTLLNRGTATLSVTQITANGDFAQTNTCGSSVASGASCAIAVTFTPTATGARSGTLTVTDTDSSSSQTAALSGTGATPVPQASLSPSTLTFTGQAMGTASGSQTVTLSNGGTGALTVAQIAASGDFAETNTCGSSVAAGASCTISVTFTPSVVGTRGGSLNVTDNASTAQQSATLSGHGLAKVVAGCAETGTFSFPGCLSLSSPTQVVAGTTPSAFQGGLQADANAPRTMGAASGNFQSQFAAQTAQIAALLDGSDPAPSTTLGTLGQAAISTNVGGMISQTENCFGPGIYYSHHPDSGMSVNPPIIASGRIPPGDLGIWSQTDSTKKQACAAMELNYLLSSAADKTQFALGLAAEVEFLAGTSFPATSGQSYDATAGLTQVLNTSSVSLTSVTVTYDGTSYLYSSVFTVQMNSQTISCTIKLKHTPGANSTTYSGVAQYSFDDGTNLAAGTTRYQRTSATHLDIGSRETFYPSGSTPQIDSNGELNPGDPNVAGGNATFVTRFSRVGASFDPTSPLTTGSFLFVMQINAQNTTGVGLPGLLNTFQLVLPGDGTGSAFYGYGDAAIDYPTVSQVSAPLASGVALGTIDRIYCMRQSGVSHLNAQFQALTYNSTDGMYEPSTTVASHARFAPTGTCQYTNGQWNNGVASGFWYDRNLQFATSQSQPTPPSPIPSYVVADPNDTNNHLFNLFGDNSTWPQTLINAGGSGWTGYTFPTLY